MTLNSALVKATPAMAFLAPFVVLGFLYVLAVQPERAAAEAALQRAAGLRDQLSRARATAPSVVSVINAAVVKQEFELRAADEDRARDVADAITGLANSPAVGGVRNLSVRVGAPDTTPIATRIDVFEAPIGHTPISVTFDATHEQIQLFLENVRILPAIFEVRSIELQQAVAPLMRLRVSLFVFRRIEPTPPAQPVVADAPVQLAVAHVVPPRPRPRNNPVASNPVAPGRPDPIVHSILFSASRRVALVDGRIVKTGDRVGEDVVRAIEPNAVVLAAPNGSLRRVELEHPPVKMARW